jgi:hypothetical protein
MHGQQNIKHCKENQNKHLMFNYFISKIVPFVIYRRAEQAIDNNMTHRVCLRNNADYKQTYT